MAIKQVNVSLLRGPDFEFEIHSRGVSSLGIYVGRTHVFRRVMACGDTPAHLERVQDPALIRSIILAYYRKDKNTERQKA